jgi:glycosyltransferase involved in cell wall biosynthesis
MRVLIFSTDDHLYPAGGAESAMGEITKRMPDVEFDLITAKLRKGVKAEETVGNVNIYRMGFGIPRIDGYILALFGQYCAYKLMKKHRYDLMWCIMASYGAFAAVRVKKKTGVPMLLTLQEGDPIEYILNKVRFVRGAFDQIFKQADGLQPISNFLLKWGQDMGFHGKAWKVIPNGVDVGSFTAPQSAEEVRKMRESFGFPPESFVLITSSRLVEKNGVGDVIDALPLLPNDVCFVICGSGRLEEELRAKVKKHGLESRVKFLGFVKITELPLLLRASDAFIRPSLSEGLGNAFLESMATRTPTIGTPVGGIPDFLHEGETGFLCKPENPASIADTVGRIRALPASDKERILDNAYRAATTIYDWDPITKDMRALFEQIINGSRRP